MNDHDLHVLYKWPGAHTMPIYNVKTFKHLQRHLEIWHVAPGTHLLYISHEPSRASDTFLASF